MAKDRHKPVAVQQKPHFNDNSLAVKRAVEQVTVEQEEAGFCFNRFLGSTAFRSE